MHSLVRIELGFYVALSSVAYCRRAALSARGFPFSRLLCFSGEYRFSLSRPAFFLCRPPFFFTPSRLFHHFRPLLPFFSPGAYSRGIQKLFRSNAEVGEAGAPSRRSVPEVAVTPFSGFFARYFPPAILRSGFTPSPAIVDELSTSVSLGRERLWGRCRLSYCCPAASAGFPFLRDFPEERLPLAVFLFSWTRRHACSPHPLSYPLDRGA